MNSSRIFRAYVKQISINNEENKGKDYEYATAAFSAFRVEQSLTLDESISTSFYMLKENAKIN